MILILGFISFLLLKICHASEPLQNHPPSNHLLHPSLSEQLSEISFALGHSRKVAAEEVRSFQSNLTRVSQVIDSLSVAKTGVEASQRATIVCKIAKYLNIGKLSKKDDDDYTAEENINWSQTCRLPAACFIRPQTTLDVAILLRVVRYAQSKFAIRSGGHNPNAGFGSVGANGVLIDLQDLDDLSLNSEEELTTGPGNRWIDIYNFLSNYKLGAIGGRDGDVGVPGFLLGGGMSFFPNLYGFGADNVKSFEIVLANSSIVDANANTNPDLFTALKGGASNFGIVVKFQIYTHPLHQIWYSLDLYAASDYAAILNATVQAQVAMETDPKLGLFVNINPEVIIVGKLYSEWTLPPSGFSSFEAITPVGVYIPATNGTLSELVDSIKIGSFPARRETYTVTHGVDLKLYTEIHKRYLSMLNTSIASSANLSYTIQPVGTAGVKAGAARGGNTLGLYPAAQSWHASLVEWTSEEDDTSAHGMVNTMGKSVEELSRNEKSYYPFQFMNDASYTQNPLASYGAQNLAKLRDVGKAYDPDGLFQTLQNSGFLLSRK